MPDKNFDQSKLINLWIVYAICLLIATLCLFLFGTSSPLYAFNSDIDYQWYMTIGNALTHGKIPYRDLFEHKGPIVYFVTAFCCLFPDPRTVILIIEILCMSLFFFFAYRICRKRLNTFYSLITIPILAFGIFASWGRISHAAVVEEFCLPMLAYFLLCWFEFLFEKRDWNWIRALCLGFCFGIIFWIKYTIFYFMIAPMIIWLVISLRKKQYRTIIYNVLCMLAGVLIITAPVVIFYALHQAFDDLFQIYFVVNLTAYNDFIFPKVIETFTTFFALGPAILFLMFWGVYKYTTKYWNSKEGLLLLISYLSTLCLYILTSKGNTYYCNALFPYAILGVIDIVDLAKSKLAKIQFKKWFYTLFVIFCLAITIPFSDLPYESDRPENDYAPIVIANIIHDYEINNHTQATLFCYKLWDLGIHNASGIIPNNYFYAKSYFDREKFPAMYEGFENSIKNQTSDFVVIDSEDYYNEIDFISQYYQPYTGDLKTSSYKYWNCIDSYVLFLLIKK